MESSQEKTYTPEYIYSSSEERGGGGKLARFGLWVALGALGSKDSCDFHAFLRAGVVTAPVKCAGWHLRVAVVADVVFRRGLPTRK